MAALTVFQDLTMTGPEVSREEVRRALAESASALWRFDAEGSEESSARTVTEAGLMIFERAEDGRFPAARLVLWPETTGFSVPNIVPVEMGELSTENYNGLLEEFASLIRSEEHTSELQSLMRISYAVFCLKNTPH